jgi:hypothetical protein
MAKRMESHVFISNNRVDSEYVDRLADYLGSIGIPVWIDRGAAAPERWALEIQQNLDRCSAVVVVQSEAATRSAWVRREIERAI